MATDFSSDAGGSLAGFIWQQHKALLVLLDPHVTGTISIEKDDDVVVFNLQKEIVATVQYKHSFAGGSLTTSSPEFWKTIRIWKKLLPQMGPETSLILATTLVGDELLAPFRISAKTRPSQQACAGIVSKLSSCAKQAGNQKLLACYRDWLALSQTEKLQIVNKFRLADAGQTVNQIGKELLDAISGRILLSGERAHRARERIVGWFDNEVAARLGVGGCEFSSAEFRSVLERVRDELSPPAFSYSDPAATYSAEDIAKEKQNDPIYLKQIDLLGANDGDRKDAVLYVLKARTERQVILSFGIGGKRDVDVFDDELEARWRNESRSVFGQGTLPEGQKQERGWALYNNCMRMTLYLGLQRHAASVNITCGSFHLRADKRLIGWHPDYLLRLSNGGG